MREDLLDVKSGDVLYDQVYHNLCTKITPTLGNYKLPGLNLTLCIKTLHQPRDLQKNIDCFKRDFLFRAMFHNIDLDIEYIPRLYIK